MLRDKQLLPVVCFVFSRKRCDDYLELVKGMDLNSQEDKHYVSQFFRQALSRLNESDRQLQQVITFQIILFFFIHFQKLGCQYARNG
jgi:antiviral helicase SKI2